MNTGGLSPASLYLVEKLKDMVWVPMLGTTPELVKTGGLADTAMPPRFFIPFALSCNEEFLNCEENKINANTTIIIGTTFLFSIRTMLLTTLLMTGLITFLG